MRRLMYHRSATVSSHVRGAWPSFGSEICLKTRLLKGEIESGYELNEYNVLEKYLQEDISPKTIRLGYHVQDLTASVYIDRGSSVSHICSEAAQ